MLGKSEKFGSHGLAGMNLNVSLGSFLKSY